MENLHYYLTALLILTCLATLYVRKGLKKTAIIALEAVACGPIAALV